jgi:hypothetical protein
MLVWMQMSLSAASVSIEAIVVIRNGSPARPPWFQDRFSLSGSFSPLTMTSDTNGYILLEESINEYCHEIDRECRC